MLVEVLVVIAVLAVLVAILLPALAKAKRKSAHLGCVNNLKQIGLAYRIWEGDNDDLFPMGVSVTSGGSMELVSTGNVLATSLTMSNELGTPKILHCPEDITRTNAFSFASLSVSNLSYFVGVDATNDVAPERVLSGDANLEIGRVPARSGLLELPKTTSVFWSVARHKYGGNIGLADLSIRQTSSHSLTEKLQSTGLTTNRLTIP